MHFLGIFSQQHRMFNKIRAPYLLTKRDIPWKTTYLKLQSFCVYLQNRIYKWSYNDGIEGRARIGLSQYPMHIRFPAFNLALFAALQFVVVMITRLLIMLCDIKLCQETEGNYSGKNFDAVLRRIGSMFLCEVLIYMTDEVYYPKFNHLLLAQIFCYKVPFEWCSKKTIFNNL